MKRSKDSLKQWLIPGGFFGDLGIEYMGPVDGHNMNQLVRAIGQPEGEAGSHCPCHYPEGKRL